MERQKGKREKRNREQETKNLEAGTQNREKEILNIEFQRRKIREREYGPGKKEEGKEQK